MRALALLLLAGCPWVGPDSYDDRVQDLDGDGSISTRFGGSDCADEDASIRDCDVDRDGVRSAAVGGEDCDDTNAAVLPGAEERCNGIDDDCDGLIDDNDEVTGAPGWFLDSDGDGVGSGDAVVACVAPTGHVAPSGDCNDDAPEIKPGLTETCEPIDRNCDGELYAGAVGSTFWYRDHDGDGWGGDLAETACAPSDPAYVDNRQDCDDADPAATLPVPFFPDLDGDGVGAGVAVAACTQPDGHAPIEGDCDDADDTATAWQHTYADLDGDGFGVEPAHLSCGQPANTAREADDCDDTRDTVFPDAPETCNGRDDDCNTQVDDNALDAGTWYTDGDGDGFGAAPVLACGPSPGITAAGEDCDDTDPDAFPGAPEICYDTVRQDCLPLHLDDCDGDGAVDQDHGGTDCNDADPHTAPGAPEACDGLDNDCDGLFDDQDPDVDLSTAGNWFDDLDGDGYGAGTPTFACVPPPHTVASNTDCDDADPQAFPDTRWYEDADGDGFGAEPGIVSCEPPPGTWIPVGTDCDDTLADTFPGATEYCDAVDNDCDGTVDEEPADGGLFWTDSDGDGFGDAALSQIACSAVLDSLAANPDDCDDHDPVTYPGAPEICGDLVRQDCSLAHVDDCDADGALSIAGGGDDCDDENAATVPGAPEICDGLDNDCNGLVDVDDPHVDLTTTRDYFEDADQDGHGNPDATLTSCDLPPGYVLEGTDCDDTDAHISPDAIEVCATSADDDCDGFANDADPEGPADAIATYPDLDGDGDGNGDHLLAACALTAGFVGTGTDCDDDNATVRPGADEICDGLDNDCDALVDDADAGIQGQDLWYQDVDNDGFPVYASFALGCQPPSADFVADPGQEDCNDSNVFINPNQPEGCSPADVDDDCDGLVDAEDDSWQGLVLYRDADGDGFGNAGDSQTSCETLEGWVDLDGDCNDGDPAVHPATTWYRDADDDGVGSTESVVSCNPPGHWSLDTGDCDDLDPHAAPGLPEVCGAADEDCDGLVDDADPSLSDGRPHAPDTDGDGFGDPDPTLTTIRCPDPHDAWVESALAQDCDDADPDAFPGAEEHWYDGIDQDCDGGSDHDQDGDGEDRLAAGGPDCDDLNPLVRSTATEVWYDGVDQDCAGDDDFDQDGDGFIARLPAGWPVEASPGPADCDDLDAAQRPQTFHWTPGNPLPAECSGDSLQDLIDCNCDSVLVLGAGTVDEGLSVVGRSIEIVGVSDPRTDTPLADCGTTTCLTHDSDSVLQVLPGIDPVFGGVRDSSLVLTEVTVHGGQAQRGGGVRVTAGQELTLTRAVITDNSVTSAGGGIFLGPGAVLHASDAWIQDNRSLAHAAAVSASSAHVEIVGGFVRDNAGTASGGLRAVEPLTFELTDVLLHANSQPQVALTLGEEDAVLHGVEMSGDSLVEDHTANIVTQTTTGAGTLRIEDSRLSGAGFLLWVNSRTVIEGSLLQPDGIGVIATLATLEIDHSVFAGPGGAFIVPVGNVIVRDSWFEGDENGRLASLGEGATAHFSHTRFADLSQQEPLEGSVTLELDDGSSAQCGPDLLSCFGTPGSTVSQLADPAFVRFGPGLPVSVVDLHLRASSALRGQGSQGTNIGVYPDQSVWDVDSDNDHIPDGFELAIAGDLSLSRTTDHDADHLLDGDEYDLGTHPGLQDTDGEGISDGDEVLTDPLNPDTDGDELDDFRESLLGTDPTLEDTDGDEVLDGWEVDGWPWDPYTSDPLHPDTDGDGLTDGEELYNQGNPNDPDTDGDGLDDGFEYHGPDGDRHLYDWESDLFAPDSDFDGVSDFDEYHYRDATECTFQASMQPFNPDSDYDGLDDSVEFAGVTCAVMFDTDQDNLSDADEASYGTDPTLQDTDADGIGDGFEQAYGTDPLDPDSDDDGVPDGVEVGESSQMFCYSSDPLVQDTDDDGLLDGEECFENMPASCAAFGHDYPSSSYDFDSDGDGLSDFDEVNSTLTCPNTNDTDLDGFSDFEDPDPLDPLVP